MRTRVVTLAFLLGACDGARLEETYSTCSAPDDVAGGACRLTCDAFIECVTAGGAAGTCAVPCAEGGNPCESAAQAAERHGRVAARRRDGVADPMVMVHHPVREYGYETTLEAYRSSFELGADGHDLDIRATRDGVAVLFHDDFSDAGVKLFTRIEEHDYAALQQAAVRHPAPFGADARIPSLVEGLILHQRHAGLMHLDLKIPGLDDDLVALLDALDMWDQVVFANDANAALIRAHPRYAPSGKPAFGLYHGRLDEDPAAIQGLLAEGIGNLFVDDPRLTLAILGRTQGPVAVHPARPRQVVDPAPPAAAEAELVAIIADDRGAGSVGTSDEDGARIVARAQAALDAGRAGYRSAELVQALKRRIIGRSRHTSWLYHGVDGAEALRTLVALADPWAVSYARFVLWRRGPVDNPFEEWRMKSAAWSELAAVPHQAAAAVARDYLALSDEEATALGSLGFEPAARLLLAATPDAEAARELLTDGRSEVRGAALLALLARAGEPWAAEVLAEQAIPGGGNFLDLATVRLPPPSCPRAE
jgi:hypothetical protein